jgi:hypothetical protein
MQDLSPVDYLVAQPIPYEYEPPSTINDVIYGDISPDKYLIKVAGDCLILKIGEKYAGVKRSNLLSEMKSGDSTFYECSKLITGSFLPNAIYSVPYFAIRTTLGIYYIPYAQMRAILMCPWLFWELTKAGTLKFTASRSAVVFGGPVSSMDHCQDGTEKEVYDTQPFEFAIADDDEEEIPNIIALKYGEQKKEIPYDESMTIGAIRDKAMDFFGLTDAKLVYTGRVLSDDTKTVKGANVQKGFTILVQKVGGKRRTKRGRGRGKKTYRKV